MTLRVRRQAGHDHSGAERRRFPAPLAYLALAIAALFLPATGAARATAPTSNGGQILTAPRLQVNPSPGSYGNPNVWSFAERPFSALRSNAVITVTSPTDALPSPTECMGVGGDCSLRQAIDKAAASGDEIELLADTYTVTLGTLLVDKSLTFVGAGSAATIIDGSGNVDANTHQLSRIMKIVSGQTVSINNLTLTGGVDDNDENLTGSAIATVSLNGGGAIFNNGGSLSLADVVFSNNASNNPIGGAIATAGGSLAMTNVTFADNGAGVAGSMRIRSGAVTGTGVTFTNSFGEFGGGSVYIDGGSLSLTNSTIDGSAGLTGFGIGIQNAGGQVTLTSVTIAHSQGYALMTDVGASTTIRYTIIGQGGRGDCVPSGRSDSVTDVTTAAAVTVDSGHNLDQTGDCSLSASNHNVTGDPLLTSPGHFGGLTETDAILAGSPAIDAGNVAACPPADQRGIGRSGLCDIGAFEFIAGVHASFTYAPADPIDSGGDNGAFVTFTNTSSTTNDATLSYFWDFGDGTTSTGASPGHGFSAPDHPTTYTVTLQVTDSAGSVDQTSQDITARPANEQPTASFTFGAAAPNVPVHFDASASDDPDGSIASYDWNWGDDSNNSTGADQVTPTHTYGSAGTYTVTLTVTDDGGRTDVVSQNVTVAVPSVSAYFVDGSWAGSENGDTVTGPEGQPLTVGTDAFATIGNALSAANGGHPDSTIQVAAGSYFEEGSLSLQQDGDHLVGGGSDVTQVHLTQLSVDGTNQVVRGFGFIGPGTWDDSTGCSDCGSSAVVRLSGDRNNDDDDVWQGATIRDNRISGGYIGIAFTSGNSDNFPTSGSQARNNEILHNVTGVSVDGGSNNVIGSNDIHDNGDTSQTGTDQPQAAVLITDQAGNQPTGNVVQDNTIASTIANGISIRTSGNTIEDNTISNSGTSSLHFKESSGIELVAGSNDSVNDNAISGNTITGSAFAGIKIGDQTDGNTVSSNTITGTLHGGRDGNSQDPGAGGTAILITGYGATNTTIFSNTLGPNSGHGILQEGNGGGATGNVAHQNSISGNSLGGVLNNDSASFDATQNWWGAANGPSGDGPGTGDSVSDNVTFDPWLTCAPGGNCANQSPQASLTATPSAVPGSLQVAVDGSASVDPDGMIVSYAWSFGDGASATGATASHTYAAAGTYTITLTVTDNNEATGTATHQVTVPAVAANQPPQQTPAANKPPQASFVFSPPIASSSLEVSVNGSGSVDPDGTVASYAWSFGDGASATGATASHTYAAAGTYTITLTVTDNQGAKGTATQQATVPIPLPPPVKGVSVDVLPFSGTVLVNGHVLAAGEQIPFGAIVDTTHGTVLLESISPSGTLDAAYFAGAVFQLLKTPAGLTELVLQGGDFSVCAAKGKRHAAAAGQPPKKKTVVRSLWGNGHGQFVTKGRYAAATVRGTIWNTQDRCDGTFVNVQRGIVSVQDLVRHKTTSVTAGHSFLVKP